ncbi:MAG: hypothetical protein JO000_26675 [Alphaproteobacteria bacterium]|nr:hypothetical protein [Alphaproteobacteria bacterium]
MHRLLLALVLLLAALIASLGDVGSADAARRKRYREVVREDVAPPFPVYVVPANRPRWLPWHQCYTDEGRGRYLPCDLGGGGGS